MSDQQAEDYKGPERRDPSCVQAYMRTMNMRMEKIETALFATDDKNEFGRPGIMRTMTRLDGHLDALCSAARLMKWGVAIVGGVAGTGKALGWW